MKSILVLSLLLDLTGSGSMVMAEPGTFTATGKMTTERSGHTATLLTNGKVLIVGGSAIISGWPVWASTELYDPATGTFTFSGSLTTPRYGHTATLLPNGNVLIAGGDSYVSLDNSSSALASMELYDPSTGIFTGIGVMTTPRSRHTATLLANGTVLIAGGSREGGNRNQQLASADLYDPATGTFTATGAMTAARAFHRATLLSSGKVLIDGGRREDDEDDRPNAELYDPDSGTFSLSGRTSYPGRFPSTATLLTSGKVLDTLEYSCDPNNQAELYDPSAQTFTPTANMTAVRGGRTATSLPDGKVLIAGGGESDLPPGIIYLVDHTFGAELYDSAAGTFSPTGKMTTGRVGHSATLLPDGAVLIAGGSGWYPANPHGASALTSAEIYHPAVLVRSPVLFSLSGDGKGPGAILHSGTHRVVSPDNPAVAGEALEIYLTGLTDGSVIAPQVAIGGRMAEVLFFGKAPGFANLNQVNVRMPSGVVAGPAVGVRLTYLARPSNEVTIGVQ